MKSLEKTLSALTAAWIALGALSLAQVPQSVENAPPPRIPRSAQAMPAVPTAATPAPTVPSSRTRPIDAGPQVERSAREPAAVVSIAASDERYSHTYWDTDEHGTIWVRARSYKASFGADGATYYPLFGSKQPRHYPLQLSLASATSNGQPVALEPITGATRDGANVVIHRGVVDEVYEVGVESMEQTFVVRERPQGDLQLFVSLQSEMVRSEGMEGLEFSNELGAVRYGRAFARETDGTRRALTTQSVDGGVRIDVGAEYVATRSFPLVIDPVVSTFSLDLSSYDNFDSDVAYDATTDRYLFVYEETVTATDLDVYSVLRTGSGGIVSDSYVDHTTQDWDSVSVANLNANDQFLVAGNVFDGSITSVRARETAANTLFYGPVITIASPAHLFDQDVSVGGDPYGSAPAFYCVVYTGTGGISARLVTSTGTLQGTSPLILGTGHEPCVSKGNGGTRWNIAWRSVYTIHCAQVEWDGSGITTPDFAVFSPSNDPPTVSSPRANGDYLVAWVIDWPTDTDIQGAVLNGGTVVAPAPLTEIENALIGRDQNRPHVDCDGQQFTLVYTESTQVAPFLQDVYAATYYAVGTQVGCTEGHIGIATTAANELSDSIVSAQSTGGAARRFALSWNTAAGAQHDIYAGLYDSPLGGAFSTHCSSSGGGGFCPCANGAAGHGCANSVNASGALLAGTGLASVSGDSVVLTASGMPTIASCLFFQGTAAGSGAFGDGIRCVGGSIVRLAPKTASGGVASFPAAGDLHVSVKGAVPAVGGQRFYQCWYRNSGAFCTPSTFNLTNGLKVMWLP